MSGIMQIIIGNLLYRVHGFSYYTSPGTYSWTCPIAVSNISITGAGGVTGTAYSYTQVTAANFVDGYFLTYSNPNCFGVDVGTNFDAEYASRYATCQAYLDSITSSTYSSYSVPSGSYMYCTSTGTYLRYISNSGADLARIGGILYQRTSSTVSGQNSTAFGYTFASASSPPATVSTYTNISVTPGTSYTIVVGNGGTAGYVNIEY